MCFTRRLRVFLPRDLAIAYEEAETMRVERGLVLGSYPSCRQQQNTDLVAIDCFRHTSIKINSSLGSA
jgi:hypothetical protein